MVASIPTDSIPTVSDGSTGSVDPTIKFELVDVSELVAIASPSSVNLESVDVDDQGFRIEPQSETLRDFFVLPTHTDMALFLL